MKCIIKLHPVLEHSVPIKWGGNHLHADFQGSANGQCFLFNGSKLKICVIFRNTKDLQLQLKSVNIYNYVKMLNPLGKKKTPKISNGALRISVHYYRI